MKAGISSISVEIIRLHLFRPCTQIKGKITHKATVQEMSTDKRACILFTDSFEVDRERFCVKIGANSFSKKGININLENEEVSISGEISYGCFEEIHGDIMGPFCWVPFMQCRHSVLSMYHRTAGALYINDKSLPMDGVGYIDGDRGCSFPKRYLWTQSILNESRGDSIMLSVADIPLWGVHFRGCICSIYYKRKEYRLATYKGCRILKYGAGKVLVKQGKYLLCVTNKKNGGHLIRCMRPTAVK